MRLLCTLQFLHRTQFREGSKSGLAMPLIKLLENKDELAVGASRPIVSKTSGRQLLLYRHSVTQFFAIDNLCWHLGASLHLGDIEDIGGAAVVECPAHKKLISLSHGGKEVAIVKDESQIARLHVGQQVQRAHHVQIYEDGAVWADVSSAADGRKIKSDDYNLREEDNAASQASVQSHIHHHFAVRSSRACAAVRESIFKQHESQQQKQEHKQKQQEQEQRKGPIHHFFAPVDASARTDNTIGDA